MNANLFCTETWLLFVSVQIKFKADFVELLINHNNNLANDLKLL